MSQIRLRYGNTSNHGQTLLYSAQRRGQIKKSTETVPLLMCDMVKDSDINACCLLSNIGCVSTKEYEAALQYKKLYLMNSITEMIVQQLPAFICTQKIKREKKSHYPS